MLFMSHLSPWKRILRRKTSPSRSRYVLPNKEMDWPSQTFFDQKYGPTWHCIVGSDFRAFVTHDHKHFIFFYVGKTAICLFKAGWIAFRNSPKITSCTVVCQSSNTSWKYRNLDIRVDVLELLNVNLTNIIHVIQYIYWIISEVKN